MDHHIRIRSKVMMNSNVQLIIDKITTDEQVIHLENDIFLEEKIKLIKESFE